MTIAFEAGLTSKALFIRRLLARRLLPLGSGASRMAVGGNGNTQSAVAPAVRKLMADAAQYFPGTIAPPRVVGTSVERRRLSEVARVEVAVGDATTAIYVKVHQNPHALASRMRQKARLEFDTLRHLHERFGGVPGFSVVRPIACFPEDLAVVTEAAGGENLHGLLKRQSAVWRRGASHAMASQHCEAAGVWLRHFQEITAQRRREPLPCAQLLEWIECDAALCVKLGLPPAVGEGLVSGVRARALALRDRPFAVVGQHRDFQPDNILVSPQGVTVLDFPNFHYGAPYSDVARFMATVGLMGKSPLYPRARLRGLAAAFLRGYGGEMEACRSALVLYLILHTVGTARAVGSWPRPPLIKALVVRRTMRFLASWWRELSDRGDSFIDAG